MGATFLGPVILRHYKTWVWSALHSDLLCNSTGCRIPKISTLPERTTIIWRLPNSLISSVNVFWSPIRYQVTCWEKNGGEDCTCPHEAYVPDHWFPKIDLRAIMHMCLGSASFSRGGRHCNYRHRAAPILGGLILNQWSKNMLIAPWKTSRGSEL